MSKNAHLKNLVILRKQRGFSQEKLAAKSGVSYNTVIKIERNGITDPRISTAVKLAKALKVKIDDLIK